MLLVVGALVVDVTVDTGSTSSSASAGGTGHAVLAITGFAFDPPTLEVAAGQRVDVVNDDAAEHTVTSGPRGAPDGTIDVSVDGGADGSFTIEEPGEYDYVCAIHPGMKGTIDVST